MFVRSRIDKPLTFRKGGRAWTIKPHSVTLIDDPTVTAREIKGCYGSRVDVISDEGTYSSSQEGRQTAKHVIKYKGEQVKKVESVKKIEKPKKLDEKSLDDILAQVNKELGEIKVDHKKVDTQENAKSSSKEIPAGVSNGNLSKSKNSENVEDCTNPTGGKVEPEKKARVVRARKAKTAKKSSVKRTTKKSAK